MSTHRESRSIAPAPVALLPALALLVTLALTACGGSDDTRTTSPTATPTTPAATVTTGSPPDAGALMWRGDRERTGIHEGGGPSQPGELAWKFKTGAEVFSSSGIAAGMVYFGCCNRHLCALK